LKNTEENSKNTWKIWKKASRIVIRYEKYGRKTSRIVKRLENMEEKAS